MVRRFVLLAIGKLGSDAAFAIPTLVEALEDSHDANRIAGEVFTSIADTLGDEAKRESYYRLAVNYLGRANDIYDKGWKAQFYEGYARYRLGETGPVQTPHLDAFAAESLVMTRAFPESLPTLPTRRALYTGQRVYPFHNGDFHFKGDFVGAPGWGPIPEEQPTLAEMFRDAGCPGACPRSGRAVRVREHRL